MVEELTAREAQHVHCSYVRRAFSFTHGIAYRPVLHNLG